MTISMYVKRITPDRRRYWKCLKYIRPSIKVGGDGCKRDSKKNVNILLIIALIILLSFGVYMLLRV